MNGFRILIAQATVADASDNKSAEPFKPSKPFRALLEAASAIALYSKAIAGKAGK